MAVSVLTDKNSGESVMYCTTSDWAFGPVFTQYEEAEIFIEWLERHGKGDPRLIEDRDLERLVGEWRHEIQERVGKRVRFTDEDHDLYGMVGTVREAYGDGTVWAEFALMDDRGPYRRGTYPAWDEVEVVEEPDPDEGDPCADPVDDEGWGGEDE